MDAYFIKDKKRTIAILYLFLQSHPGFFDKKNYINTLAGEIQDSKTGYAGFKTREFLKKYLKKAIFGQENIKKIPRYTLNQKEAVDIIGKIVRKCHNKVFSSSLKIFVFPTYDSFIKNKMSGANGYAPWKNTILIFIYPTNGWQNALKKTIAHEYAHSISLMYHKWDTLLDSIIFEGIAENFQKYATGGNPTPWSTSLNLNQCKEVFEKIKPKLYSRDIRHYQSLFFSDKNFPLWSGYAIGFQLVKLFIKKNKRLSWEQIFTLTPKQILKEVKF